MQGDPLMIVTSAPGVQVNQPAPAVQINNGSHTEDRKRLPYYNSKAAVATGIIQISCGFLAFVLEIIYLGSSERLYPRDKVAVGIWGGALFSFTGLIGIISAKKKRGMVTLYMVLSIIAIITALFGFYYAIGHFYVGRYSYDPGMVMLVGILLTIVNAIEILTAVIASSFGCAARLCCGGQPVIQERVIYMTLPQGATHANDFPMGSPPAYQPSQVAENY